MKKSVIYYLFAVVCTVCLFTACSDDDDDDDNKVLTVDNVVGTYKGSLLVLGTPIPNTSIFVTKVSDSKINIELKDFEFSGIPIGNIKVECSVTADGNDLNINGSGNVTIAAMDNLTVPVVVDGDVNSTTLDIDISISDIPLLGTIKVEFEGKK